MKDAFGYTLKNNYDSSSDYLRHEFIVDGCNIDGDSSAGMWSIKDSETVTTRKEALKVMKRYCKIYDKVTIYDQWVECDLNESGFPHCYCTVQQKIEDYKNGQKISGISIL